ncbi:MAG: hypothetical protein JOZ90_09695 [Alphaproteobacteria bacterium]|nr:hypothetical protein [Alphaproteobacteria bacterium]MBV9372989.1 hypothetical protein [Alphaproteobacteria bacterium]MBV9901356.1 hypothetical protein [Alphaproteobacteria bacterium]
MIVRLLLLATAAAAAAAFAAPALAQAPATAAAAAPAADDAKVSQLIVYGDDPCPPGSADEIVVCARKPESERYRIPERLRGDPGDPKNQAWSNRASELQYVGRNGIGSCSPVGPGGASGCFNQLVREARAERAGRDEINWNALIETARRERLGKIDAEAAAEDAAAPPPR